MGMRGEETQMVSRGVVDESEKVGIRLEPRGSNDGRMVGLGSRTRASDTASMIWNLVS